MRLLAEAMAWRTRASGVAGPSAGWQAKACPTAATAISAARSPAACPPTPSTTRNAPSAGSIQYRSSLRSRTSPVWVAAPQSSEDSVIAHFEGEAHCFRQGDFGAIRQRDLDVARNAAGVQPGSIPAQVRNLEFPARRIAPQPQMLARNLVCGVKRQVYPQILAAASDGDLILRDQVGLPAGIVLVANLRENRAAAQASVLAIPRHTGGSDRWLSLYQRGFGAAISRLGAVVQLGVDLDIARRHGGFAVGEEPDPPAAGRCPARLARGVAPQQPSTGVPSRQAGSESALGVLLQKLLHAGQARVVVRVQVYAEDAGHQDAVAQLQAAQFHIPDQFIDDDLPADARHRLHCPALRHAKTPLSARHNYPRRTRNLT